MPSFSAYRATLTQKPPAKRITEPPVFTICKLAYYTDGLWPRHAILPRSARAFTEANGTFLPFCLRAPRSRLRTFPQRSAADDVKITAVREEAEI